MIFRVLAGILRHRRLRSAPAAAGAAVLMSTAAVAGDGTLELTWAWSVPRPSDVSAVVLDSDTDGVQEIVLTDRTVVQSLRISNGELTQLWTSLPLEPAVRALALSPGNGTGPPEVLAATAAEIRILDPRSGVLVRSVSSAVGDLHEIAVADVESDGELEIVSCGYSGIAIQDLSTGATIATTPSGACDQLLTGQLDSDTPLEILVADDDEGVRVFDGASLESEWVEPSPGGHLAQIGQLDGEGPLEILTYSYDHPIRAWKGTSGELLWQRADLTVLSWVPFDLASDPAQELVIGGWDTWPDPTFILDGRTGATLATLDVERPDWMVIGEVDADAAPELVWASGHLSSDGDFIRVSDLTTGELEAESLGLEGYFFGLHAQRSATSGLVELLVSGSNFDYVEHGNVLALSAVDGRFLELVDLPMVPNGPRSAGRISGLDLDGAAPLELLSTFNDLSTTSVECFDRSDAHLRWRMFVPEGSEAGQPATAELDGDTRPEILIPIEYYQPAYELRLVAVEGESGWLKWSSPSLGGPSSSYQAMVDYALGDIDGDGVDEIVFISGQFANEGLGILDAANGGVILPRVPGLGYSQLELAQLDADSALEIVATDFDGQLLIVDPATGGTESILGSTGSRVEIMVAADFTSDGVSDFATASYRRLTLTDGFTGETIWSAPFLGERSTDLAELLAFDGDGDGKPELAVANSWGIAVFSSPSHPVFRDGFESGNTSQWSDWQP